MEAPVVKKDYKNRFRLGGGTSEEDFFNGEANFEFANGPQELDEKLKLCLNSHTQVHSSLTTDH